MGVRSLILPINTPHPSGSRTSCLGHETHPKVEVSMKRIFVPLFILGCVLLLAGWYRLTQDYGFCGVISSNNPYYCQLYGFEGGMLAFSGSLIAILVLILGLSLVGLRHAPKWTT